VFELSFARCRTRLFGLFKIVLLHDLKFFESNNYEQLLWKSVFYYVIERLRKACSQPGVQEAVAADYRGLLVELINQVCDL
jgi:hypothetical protein